MSKKYDDLSREELVRLLARDQFMELTAKFWFLTLISKVVPETGIPCGTMRKASAPFVKGCFVST